MSRLGSTTISSYRRATSAFPPITTAERTFQIGSSARGGQSHVKLYRRSRGFCRRFGARCLSLACLGVAALPDFLTDNHVASGALIQVMTRYPPPEAGIFLVHPPGAHPARKIRILTELLIEHFGQLLLMSGLRASWKPMAATARRCPLCSQHRTWLGAPTISAKCH